MNQVKLTVRRITRYNEKINKYLIVTLDREISSLSKRIFGFGDIVLGTLEYVKACTCRKTIMET